LRISGILKHPNTVYQLSGSPLQKSGIRKALVERGFTPGRVGLADAKAEDDALRGGPPPLAYGDLMAQPQASGRAGRIL
jgi:hypothetical protein